MERAARVPALLSRAYNVRETLPRQMRGLRAIFSYRGDRRRGLTQMRFRKLYPPGAEKQTRLPGNVEKLARNYPVRVRPAGCYRESPSGHRPAGFLDFVIYFSRGGSGGTLRLKMICGSFGHAVLLCLVRFRPSGRQENRFVERPIVTGEVNDVHAGRFGDGFVVSAVLIVLIRDPVPVTNVSVLLLGASIASRACSSVNPSNKSREPSAKAATSRQGAKNSASFVEMPPSGQFKPLNCRFCIKKAG